MHAFFASSPSRPANDHPCPLPVWSAIVLGEEGGALHCSDKLGDVDDAVNGDLTQVVLKVRDDQLGSRDRPHHHHPRPV